MWEMKAIRNWSVDLRIPKSEYSPQKRRGRGERNKNHFATDSHRWTQMKRRQIE